MILSAFISLYLYPKHTNVYKTVTRISSKSKWFVRSPEIRLRRSWLYVHNNTCEVQWGAWEDNRSLGCILIWEKKVNWINWNFSVMCKHSNSKLYSDRKSNKTNWQKIVDYFVSPNTYLLNEVNARLKVKSKVDEFPIDSLKTVFFLYDKRDKL